MKLVQGCDLNIEYGQLKIGNEIQLQMRNKNNPIQ